MGSEASAHEGTGISKTKNAAENICSKPQSIHPFQANHSTFGFRISFGLRVSDFGFCLLLPLLVLTGCLGRPAPQEKAARQQVATVQRQYRPGDAQPALPQLTTNSPLADFLRYAALNQPAIEATYYDWVASVERITVERSLPDPRLTFQSDITDVLESLMPGVMMEFPGPGKVRARVGVASAESEAKYYAFETALLSAAYAVKKAYYQMQFLNERIQVTRDTLRLLHDLAVLAQSQQQFGKVTLQDVLRAQIEVEQMTVEVQNLEDSRAPLAAQFKAALGLQAGAADPPLPARFEPGPAILDPGQFLDEALARHPRLKAMAAEVKLAEAAIIMARKGKVPDFSLGLEANVYSSPVMYSPQAGITLPIWKDKIAADLASAQARKRAAEARLSAEQIQLAVELADKLFMLREAARNSQLLARQLVPKAKMSFDVGRANYQAGKIDYFNLADSQRTLLGFQLDEIAARAQRELALAELTSLILGRLPEGAPVRQMPKPEARSPKPEIRIIISP